MFNDESEVVRSFVAALLAFRRFPPAVIVAVGINTVNHVSASEAAVSEGGAIERIRWNSINKLRRKFFQKVNMGSSGEGKSATPDAL